MRFAVAIAAIVGVVSAQAVDPAQATASLLAALPMSLQQLALTNLPAASAAIASEIGNPTGPPSWFVGLPGAVQTYFITAAGGNPSALATGASSVASGASAAISSLASSVSSLNSVVSSRASSATGAASSAASSARSAASSGAAAVTSTGGAYPTAAIGSGLGAAAGLVAMLAL